MYADTCDQLLSRNCSTELLKNQFWCQNLQGARLMWIAYEIMILLQIYGYLHHRTVMISLKIKLIYVRLLGRLVSHGAVGLRSVMCFSVLCPSLLPVERPNTIKANGCCRKRRPSEGPLLSKSVLFFFSCASYMSVRIKHGHISAFLSVHKTCFKLNLNWI